MLNFAVTLEEYQMRRDAGELVVGYFPMRASAPRHALRGRDTSLDEQERRLRQAFRPTGRVLDPEIERLRERNVLQGVRMRVKLALPPLGWTETRSPLR